MVGKLTVDNEAPKVAVTHRRKSQCHQLNDYIKNIVKIYLLHYLINMMLNFRKTKIFDFVKI